MISLLSSWIFEPADSQDHYRHDADNGVRTAAYEVLNAFITNAASNSLSSIAQMSQVILMRLRDTVPLRQQVVSVEDKLTLDEMQTSLCTVIMVSYSTSMIILVQLTMHRQLLRDLKEKSSLKPIA